MELDSMMLVLLLFSVASLAVTAILMTRIAAAGTMGPNSTMGIRTRHTKASAAVWRAGHAAALPVMKWTGWLALVTIAVAVVLVVRADGTWAAEVALVGVLAQAVVLFRSAQVANRAARSVPADAEPDDK